LAAKKHKRHKKRISLRRPPRCPLLIINYSLLFRLPPLPARPLNTSEHFHAFHFYHFIAIYDEFAVGKSRSIICRTKRYANSSQSTPPDPARSVLVSALNASWTIQELENHGQTEGKPTPTRRPNSPAKRGSMQHNAVLFGQIAISYSTKQF
jgi:hypothetical protein